MDKAINIKDLSLRYAKDNKLVLSNINLEIEKGTVTALLGANGAGKSTLLKALAALLPIASGEILINNTSIHDFSKSQLARMMAVVLTENINNGLWSVKDFVAYGRYPFTNWLGKLKDEDSQIIEESIKWCGLTELSNTKISSLSDGNRQKVMLARAIAQQTDFILLDEPTTHLDIRNSSLTFKLIKRLSVEQGKTILFSSHQLQASLEIADYLLVYTGAEIVKVSPTEFLKNKALQRLLIGETL